jgi:histidinol dehydrogenase
VSRSAAKAVNHEGHEGLITQLRKSFQYLSKEGLASLKDTVITLAEAEGLPIHARAVKARFK